jgi:hypothetical protein
MVWTTSFFSYHAKEWTARAEKSTISTLWNRAGLVAYAFKQAKMWESFGVQAQGMYNECEEKLREKAMYVP